MTEIQYILLSKENARKHIEALSSSLRPITLTEGISENTQAIHKKVALLLENQQPEKRGQTVMSQLVGHVQGKETKAIGQALKNAMPDRFGNPRTFEEQTRTAIKNTVNCSLSTWGITILIREGIALLVPAEGPIEIPSPESTAIIKPSLSQISPPIESPVPGCPPQQKQLDNQKMLIRKALTAMRSPLGKKILEHLLQFETLIIAEVFPEVSKKQIKTMIAYINRNKLISPLKIISERGVISIATNKEQCPEQTIPSTPEEITEALKKANKTTKSKLYPQILEILIEEGGSASYEAIREKTGLSLESINLIRKSLSRDIKKYGLQLESKIDYIIAVPLNTSKHLSPLQKCPAILSAEIKDIILSLGLYKIKRMSLVLEIIAVEAAKGVLGFDPADSRNHDKITPERVAEIREKVIEFIKARVEKRAGKIYWPPNPISPQKTPETVPTDPISEAINATKELIAKLRAIDDSSLEESINQAIGIKEELERMENLQIEAPTTAPETATETAPEISSEDTDTDTDPQLIEYLKALTSVSKPRQTAAEMPPSERFNKIFEITPSAKKDNLEGYIGMEVYIATEQDIIRIDPETLTQRQETYSSICSTPKVVLVINKFNQSIFAINLSHLRPKP